MSLDKYENFPLNTYDKIRFCDTDRQGHVNNAVFSTFFETGRTELLYLPSPLHDDDATFVIARITLNYLGEMFWPGTVEIASRALRVGNSSVTMMQGLYQEGRLVADAETVLVHMSTITRRSKPISDLNREKLLEYR